MPHPRLVPEISVADLSRTRVCYADALYARVLAAGARVFLPIESRWYAVGDHEEGNRQFVVQDPDGYLLRFWSDLGNRAIPSDAAS